MQDLYILANEIRRDFKKVAFVRDGCVNIMTSPDEFIKIRSRSELPDMDKVPSMEKYVNDRLKNFDEYAKYIDSSFDEGMIITDMALLLCSDRIAECLYIGDCHYYFGIMHIYGKEFRHKMDMYDALPTLKQKNPLTLRDLVIQATQGLYIQDNKAVVLDHVAYIAKNYNTYLEKPEKLDKVKMYGYIHMGEVTWMDIEESAFIETKVEGGKSIYILESLNLENVESVLRSRNAFDFTGVKRYPYPIAILEDRELSYFVKERKKNANIIFRKGLKTGRT